MDVQEGSLERLIEPDRNIFTSPEILVGRSLGNYPIDTFLEETKKTWFYQGRHPRLGIDVGLKVLKPEAEENKANRLHEEAHNLTRLKHPNIVRVYDVGTANGLSFVVLELIKGKNLRRFLDELTASQRTISLYNILNTIGAVLDALDYARKEGLPHTDVKSPNIMVKDNGILTGMVDFGYWNNSDQSRDDIGGTAGVLRELLMHSREQKIPRKLEKIVSRAEKRKYKTPRDFKKEIDKYKWWIEEVRPISKGPFLTRRQILAGGAASLLALAGGGAAAGLYVNYKSSIDYVVDQIRETGVSETEKIESLFRELRQRVFSKKVIEMDNALSLDKTLYGTSEEGTMNENDETVGHWTNGFWKGVLWRAYQITGDERFKDSARNRMRGMRFTEQDKATINAVRFYYSHVLGFEITKDKSLRDVGLKAAEIMSLRFDKTGGFLKMFEDGKTQTRINYIDTMATAVPLLCWAYKETHDERFREMAARHCEVTYKLNLNRDGSTIQVVEFDPKTSRFIRGVKSHGYDETSCLSRGQARAIRGFLCAYEITNAGMFIEAANKCAQYFVDNLPLDKVPFYDFKDPEINIPKDSSASSEACNNLIDLSRVSSNSRWRRDAYELLRSLTVNYLSTKIEHRGLILQGCADKNNGYYTKNCLVYGDFPYLDALCKI